MEMAWKSVVALSTAMERLLLPCCANHAAFKVDAWSAVMFGCVDFK